MGYYEDLALSSQWLASIQREDNGWGLAPGQASSLVNTAEAIYVLSRAGDYKTEITKGLQFLENNVFDHLQTRGPRVRYVAFTLIALAQSSQADKGNLVDQCCAWLEGARNPDNGWGVEAKQDSDLFPTSLAIWSLQSVAFPARKLDPSLQWLLARAHDAGWSLNAAQGISPVATAYALLCLAHSDYSTHDRVRAGKEYLLQTRYWGIDKEVILGTVWEHCTFAWAIPALLALDENPYATTIAEGVRYINKLKSRHGGWNETEGDTGRTVRAQFWSVLALDAILKSFDPAKHVLRIDAERAEGVLSEPDFIKIAVHRKWATIVPARLYKSFVYVLLALAPLLLLGLHRKVTALPGRVDALLAIACVAMAWFLIKKRPKQFPKGAVAFRWVLGIFSAAGVLFGTDAESAMLRIKTILTRVKEILIQ